MSSLKFGTSGLRGLVTDLVGWPSFAHAAAFLHVVGTSPEGPRTVLIGRDLRASSPEIAAAVASGATVSGFEARDCGALPTPALALEALRLRLPAIMVTGSHIPQDRNGLKFYRPDGEITKADETAILAALENLGSHRMTTAGTTPAPLDVAAADRYRKRYIDAFAPDALAGLRVAVYQQSSVARDLLADVLQALQASVTPVGRSETFVPIDTEAHRPEDITTIRRIMADGAFDVLVTTDGDADRPLMADATGRILRGDVIGMIAARHLGADVVVVPVTAGSAIERTGGFARVMRTKVGSPHVIAGMAEARGAGLVVGFEANGGFLLGSDVTLGGRMLGALPTRDAMLPILATLAATRANGRPIADLVASVAAGETASDRLQDVPAETGADLLRRMADGTFLRSFLQPVGRVQSTDTTDGLRIELDGNRTLHFRPSGNAPEFRCYAEAATAEEADRLLRWGLTASAAAMT